MAVREGQGSVARMRDSDIRTALWRELESCHQGEDDTLMLDELSLAHGSTRIDLAVINGEIQGYELKSERDTLERLPRQIVIYGQVLDRVTLVVSDAHYDKAKDIVPTWWGVTTAFLDDGSVQLRKLRPSEPNPAQSKLAIARLLWREEALAVLEEIGGARGVRGKSREFVYQRLSDLLDLTPLRDLVRRQLKDRRNWRADRRQIRCGG